MPWLGFFKLPKTSGFWLCFSIIFIVAQGNDRKIDSSKSCSHYLSHNPEMFSIFGLVLSVAPHSGIGPWEEMSTDTSFVQASSEVYCSVRVCTRRQRCNQLKKKLLKKIIAQMHIHRQNSYLLQGWVARLLFLSGTIPKTYWYRCREREV